MKAESKKTTAEVINLDISSSGSPGRVYYQNRETLGLISQPHPCWNVLPLSEEIQGEEGCPIVIVADHPTVFSTKLRQAIEDNLVRLIYVNRSGKTLPAKSNDIPIFSSLVAPVEPAVVTNLIAAAFDNLLLARARDTLQRELQSARVEIEQLNQIGIALSTQRDQKSLLNLILQKSREITNSDAGSLYLIEETARGVKQLRFKITQNDSVKLPFNEVTLPIDASSIAGYVAMTGEELHLEDVYQISSSLPFRFNSKFDRESGYRTQSMLVVPAKNPNGEIIGVLQLINCRPGARGHLDGATVDQTVIPFPDEQRTLMRSLASQAAVAIENSHLYESIEALFEGFVKASVTAIEARDPTTSGHSFRVADLTVGLAQAMNRDNSPAFRDYRLSSSEIKEIRYASLLHDFGKIGVREEVLIKAKKLYPRQLELVKERFAYVRKTLQHEHSERKLAYLLEKGREEFFARQSEFQLELNNNLRELDEFFEFVVKCNEPTLVEEGNFQRLEELAQLYFPDADGRPRPLLTPEEVNLLSVTKGNLDEKERQQIEFHVIHTVKFLTHIPWTKDIKNIPAIAGAHHEKLTGTGYPFRLAATQIPLQSRMMAITDIYDALSAADRPYKSSISVERALDILAEETKQGFLDAELFRIFREAEIFKLTLNWKHP